MIQMLFMMVLALVVLLAMAASADIKPNLLFSDNAVLQRDIPLRVWGTAEKGEKVKVAFQGQETSAEVREGRWMVTLDPLKAGGPFTMTVSGRNTVEIKNVLVGEVWLASGQSNMQWPLIETIGGPEEMAASADPHLRFLPVPRVATTAPVSEVNAKWFEAGPDTSRDFSAVAFHFGKALRKALGCPIGLIDNSWGGTRVEAWMSSEALRPFGDSINPGNSDPGEELNPNQVSVLYNGLVAPLIPFGIRGTIWYQGESNTEHSYRYHDLFSAMIHDWRNVWGEGDFPFLFVQLAPHQEIVTEPNESAWAELREGQLLTTKTVPNTAMAVITDCGNPRDIHPKNKKPVGERLALAARALAYGEKITYKGPTYKSMAIRGDRAILEFDDADGGLVAIGGDLTGFAIAGADRKFYNATARIEGSQVVVSSPQVPAPIAVRYGWADCPVVNLYNKAGIPASPFRTDDFPMITEANKARK